MTKRANRPTWQPIAVTERDLGSVYRLCLGNLDYYRAMREPLTTEKLRRDLSALPPRAKAERKFYWGYWRKQTLVAVLEGVFHYPNKACALIGFFMVDASFQRQGVGKSIAQDFLQGLAKKEISQAILSCPDDSQSARRFWAKCGFVETGERDEYDDVSLVVMEWQSS